MGTGEEEESKGEMGREEWKKGKVRRGGKGKGKKVGEENKEGGRRRGKWEKGKKNIGRREMKRVVKKGED